MTATEYASVHGEVLKKCYLFRELSEKDIAQTLERMHFVESVYEKGALLKQPQDAFPMFGVVLAGSVQACVFDKDGNRTIFTGVHVGGTFGESLSLLKADSSPIAVVAVEKTTVLYLSADVLRTFPNDALDFLLQQRFAEMLAVRTLEMNSRIRVLSKMSLREKIKAYLKQTATDNKSDIFSVKLNRDDLATYLGVNRSALSRELSRMKKEGILDYYKDTFRLLIY